MDCLEKQNRSEYVVSYRNTGHIRPLIPLTLAEPGKCYPSRMSRLTRKINSTLKFTFALAYCSFLSLICRRLSRIVLFYHGIHKADIASFREQIAYVTWNCAVVKCCDIAGTDADGNRPTVAVTFDDAYVSILEHGVPILREYGIKAAFFVPMGNLGRCPDWTMAPDCQDKNDVVMDKQQIAALDKEGFEILSHTVSHRRLTELNQTDLETELIRSKQDLESVIGRKVPAVSYPHGACDARVYRAARKAGYTLGFTADPIVVDRAADTLGIGRFAVSPRDSLFVFKLKVHGAYQIVRPLMYLKRLLLGL